MLDTNFHEWPVTLMVILVLSHIRSIGRSAQDAVAFRSLLIIAAMHYTWGNGSFAGFTSTFLFHRGESIRLVNRWLEDHFFMSSLSCMKLVATLCIAEVGL